MAHDWFDDDHDRPSWEDLLTGNPNKVRMDFCQDTVNEEVERRYVHYQSWQQPAQPHSTRVYTEAEQGVLPFNVRQYLTALEAQGQLTSPMREWLLESVRGQAYLANWPTVPPMALVIATLFLLQGIEGVVTGRIPLTWQQRWTEDSTVH